MNTVLLLRKISGHYSKYSKILSSISSLLGRNFGILRYRNNTHFVNKGFCRKCHIFARGKNSTIHVGTGSYLEGCTFHIEGSNCLISIGEGCTLYGLEFWIEDDSGEITVGKGVKSFGDSQFAVIEGKKITIGDDCLLAKGIQIRVGDSHSIISLENNKRINESENVTVGNHVWIGEKATVLKGVIIEDNSVIGTGTVVTHHVSKNSIAVGVPSRIVKENITWDIQRIM